MPDGRAVQQQQVQAEPRILGPKTPDSLSSRLPHWTRAEADVSQRPVRYEKMTAGEAHTPITWGCHQRCSLEPSVVISEGEITEVAPPPHSTAEYRVECRGIQTHKNSSHWFSPFGNLLPRFSITRDLLKLYLS